MSARKIPSNLPRSASRARSCQYRIVLYSVERSRGWVHIPCWIWPTQFMSNALRRISFVIGQVPSASNHSVASVLHPVFAFPAKSREHLQRKEFDMSASLIRSRAMVTHAIDRHRWNEITDGAVLQEDGATV